MMLQDAREAKCTYSCHRIIVITWVLEKNVYLICNRYHIYMCVHLICNRYHIYNICTHTFFSRSKVIANCQPGFCTADVCARESQRMMCWRRNWWTSKAVHDSSAFQGCQSGQKDIVKEQWLSKFWSPKAKDEQELPGGEEYVYIICKVYGMDLGIH